MNIKIKLLVSDFINSTNLKVNNIRAYGKDSKSLYIIPIYMLNRND